MPQSTKYTLGEENSILDKQAKLAAQASARRIEKNSQIVESLKSKSSPKNPPKKLLLLLTIYNYAKRERFVV